jgi:Aldehyde dehydrogenase family
VGRQILKAAAESNLKKVTLELGGKSPTLILDDSNLDDAIKWAAFGIAYVLPLLSFPFRPLPFAARYFTIISAF